MTTVATPTASPATQAVMVSGSRLFGETYPDHEMRVRTALRAILTILNRSESCARRITFIHGAARGLDTIAAAQAEYFEFPIEPHPAQWNTHTDQCPQWHHAQPTCKMAGHRRNGEMIQRALGLGTEASPSVLLAFPVGTRGENLSPGTWGAIDTAIAAGLPTFVYFNDVLWPATPMAIRMMQGLHKLLPGASSAVGPKGQCYAAWLSDQLLPF